MYLKRSLLISACLLLSATLIKAEADEKDFKTKFGEEFGIAFKQYMTELMLANLNSYAKFSNSILERVPTLPAATSEKFKKHLETIKDLQEKLTKNLTLENVKELNSFSSRMALDMLLLSLDPTTLGDKSNSKIVTEVLNNSATIEAAALNTLAEKITNKWREMFKSIPEEELKKHFEFTQINKAIDEVAAVKIKKFTDAAAINEVVALIPYTFKYTEFEDFYKE